MLFWLQIGSAATGSVAALLWFWSAVKKSPPMTFEGIGRLERFLNGIGILNKWAAGFTGVSVLLSAAATFFSALAC